MIKNSSLILISSVFGFASILFVWFGESGLVSILTREDGVVENLSAIFYMVAIAFGFVSIFLSDRVYLPIIWTLLCLIFLGEETSWFQRVFDYSVPSIEQVNAQHEFNLHNLNVFQGGKLVHSPLRLSSILKSQNLFRVGFFGYFLVVPFLLYIPKIKGLMSKIGYKKPDTGFALVLLIVFSLSFMLSLFSPVDVKKSLAETREMLYAFFIMLYIFAFVRPNQITKPTAIIIDG
jgi:hypothetical protein